MVKNLYIQEFSKYFFIVGGRDIEKFKYIFINMGGKYQKNFVRPTGEKFGGWLFLTDKKKEIQKIIQKNNHTPELENDLKLTIEILQKKIQVLESIIANKKLQINTEQHQDYENWIFL